MFKKDGKVPAEVKKAKLEDWYSSLDDQGKIRASRYIAGADCSSAYGFFLDMIGKALADENSAFAVKLCEDAYKFVNLSDYQSFVINESLIVAYFESNRNDDAKAACEANFDLFSKVRDEIVSNNGGSMPETLQFRNYYINIIVGVESNYDLAFQMLDKYNEMGILSDEDLVYRKNSLTTHRLQKLFDGVYTYRPKGEDL